MNYFWKKDEFSEFVKQPRTFGSGIFALALVALFAVEFLFFVPAMIFVPSANFTAAVLPAVVTDFTNQDRLNNNLPALTENHLLAEAAQMKAGDMAARGYFSHNSPEDNPPWAWLDQVGYDYVYAGENLALNFYDSKDVNDAWMNSPEHRENILGKNFREIGVGVATGTYSGRNGIFIVQFFGSTAETLASGNNLPPFQNSGLGAKNSSLAWLAGSSLSRINEIFNRNSDFWQKIIATPRNSVNLVLSLFILLVSLFVIVFLVVKKKHRPARLIAGGLILILIASAFIIFNSYLSFKDAIISGAKISASQIYQL